MKLKGVRIRNFKGIEKVDFLMETAGTPHRLTALLGDNGSGKTSILQAIALTLSLATRRTRETASFLWHGFLPERVSSFGPTRVELDVVFEDEEVTLTSELFQIWHDSLPSERRQSMRLTPPSKHREVTVCFEGGRVTSPQGFEAVNQFLGRYYVKALKNDHPAIRNYFERLGDVFWFDQHRNLGFRMAESLKEETGREERGWQAGVEQLREYLVAWWGYHKTVPRRGKDYIEPLEELFLKVFPGTHFAGIEPRGNDGTAERISDFYFLLEREGRLYDLAEMSSGEQAVFPLIYEFVRLDIRRSIVLIDELELHLHPPEQQKFLAALPKIGPDCQFIITTHSEFLSSAIPTEYEVRLERGTLCL